MNKTFTDCVWVGPSYPCGSPRIIRRFTAQAAKKATLTVTGLGYFEAYVNGTPVTEYRLLPVASDYEPRDFSSYTYPLLDETVNRIYYYEFDVTEQLKDGENRLEILLGNGWYCQRERGEEGNNSFGEILKTIYRLDLETAGGTQSICSDGTESWTETAIRYNNLFKGEVIDYTFRDEEEKAVAILPTPDTEMTLAMGAPDKVMARFSPVKLGEVEGKAIFDAGVNITGVVRLATTAPAGNRVTLRFAENVNEDLTLNFLSAGGDYKFNSGEPQIMQDVFVTDGGERVFEPRFVWHAFRYFEVEGPFDAVEVCVIHSDTPITATFSSTSEGPQFLFDAYTRTQLNNMHGSYPSDCPHRERLGYTGDGQACAASAMMLLDSQEFYKKWIQDILDCQDRRNGHVQHTAPFMGGGGGPGGWGSAIVTVPYNYYKQFGDLEMLETCYAPMQHFISYLESRCEDGLLVREEDRGWCLGEWSTIDPIAIPADYVNTCLYIKDLVLVEEIANLLGKTEDIALLQCRRKRAQEAVYTTYYNAATGHFADNLQAADAFAVWCGLAGAETARQVAEHYDALGYLGTGLFGTDILLQVLFDYGHGDVALKLLESEEIGSYLYMKRSGATTLWETWHGYDVYNGLGMNSHDHPMYGSCTRHLFSGILGIRQKEGAAGYTDIIVDPKVKASSHIFSGSLLTPQGRIAVTVDYRVSPPTLLVRAPQGVKVTIPDEKAFTIQ
ncbi:MAG: family 78 glycoside hydrolase catalytic domain [Clostridia bacterium]|nr:family 78 glycoside hydrolase catalytic domain [Clostridia bacterium]